MLYSQQATGSQVAQQQGIIDNDQGDKMAISSVHPYYSAMFSKWELGIDSYDGGDAIKNKGTEYLPATSGMIADGQGNNNTLGQKSYDAYKMRAVYPSIYKEAVEAAIGIMHREPPIIKLPKKMQDMETNATLLNESLELVLRNINTQQLKTGRLGLLADLKKDKGGIRPVIVQYNEKAICNWDDTNKDEDDVDVRLVVLNESGYEMDSELSWEYVNKYRVLGLVGLKVI